MTLKDYLSSRTPPQSFEAFGQRFAPAISAHTVKKWARGERIPRREAMREIETLTDGHVTPADFYPKDEAA